MGKIYLHGVKYIDRSRIVSIKVGIQKYDVIKSEDQ